MRKLLPLAEAACVLGVCLLALLLAGQWLNISRSAAGAGVNTTVACADNLHQLSLAVTQYTQDYDERLPPTQNAQVFQAAVSPYAHSGSSVFYCPETSLPYTPNAAISKMGLGSLSGYPNTTELARDSQPHADGLYTVLFLDGTVQHGGQNVAITNNSIDPTDPNSVVVGRAKQLALAAAQYTQDYDETLPPMHTPEEFQTALAPYVHSQEIFYAPNGKPFLPNANLSGVSLANIAEPATTLLLIDQPPYVSGAPTRAYVDGHVKHYPLFYKHILWANTSGAISVWNYVPANGTYTQNAYGSFPGWSAIALADGGNDGQSRLLWNNVSGAASVWSLNSSDGTYTHHEFGPYPGWAAKTVSVASDSATHVLWTNTNRAASVWNYSTDSGTFTQHTFGPYPGWSAGAMADGPDGLTRLLWTSTNGQMSLWSLDSTSGTFTQHTFGPYPGWTALGVSVDGDNTTHILWTSTNGAASVWNNDASAGTFTQNTYGPYSGWTARAIADTPGSQTAVLWTNTSGAASFWNLDNDPGSFTQFTFGPYSGWSAVGISAAP